MGRQILFTFSVLALVVAAGCPQPVDPNEAVTPPPTDNGNITIDEVVDNPTDPNDNVGGPDNPIVEPPQDCGALPVNGQVLDCYALLSADNYCGVVFADPATPNFQLVSACGQCDGTLFSAPTGVDCGNGVTGEETPPPPLPESTCKSCHAPNDYDGLHSIEDPHPWNGPLDCTTCHGGDGTATNPVYAHICPPPAVGNRQQQILDPRAFFLSFTTAGVQFLPDYTCATQGGGSKTVQAVQWLNFINPGDIRSAKLGLGCGTCHGAGAEAAGYKGGDVVAKVERSVMGQASGLNSGSRHTAGIENVYADRRGKLSGTDYNTMGDFSATDVTNPEYNPATRSVGEVGSLRMAEVSTTDGFQFDTSYTAADVNNANNNNNINLDNYPNGINNARAADLYQEILNQACTGCHLQNAYNNNRAGDYRSTGCSGCHIEVNKLGRATGRDPNTPVYEPADPNFLTPGEHMHVADHRVRNVMKFPGQGVNTVVQGIGLQNCLVCHEGSNRTTFQYQGIRLDQNQDLTNGNFYPSNNTVAFTNAAGLFGENQFFNNRNINQWIETEIWEADIANLIGQAGQDATPPDVHHEAGMGCADCHSTGATHGRGQIYSRMKIQTHENDVLCETCHGTIDGYAQTDGTHILTQDGHPLTNTYADGDPSEGQFWLVSKLDGSTHYIPQTLDVVNGASGEFGKQYPIGAARQGSIFNYVASAAMGRYNGGLDLADGMGPFQPHMDPNAFQVTNNFSHSDGVAGQPNQGMECYTCHASWQNNCVGCHLDANFDNNPQNFFYSQVIGERIYFNFAANFVYQNPVDFMLGINDRGKISSYQGMHRFWSYTDFNNDTSNRIATGDRNGLGFDPALLNANRNDQPALENNPFTPHSIRARATQNQVGARACLNCHLYNNNATFAYDQNQDEWANVQDYIANTEDYANAIPFNVNMAYGLGSDLWLFDADGNAVVDTNNAPVYNLDRIVEQNGASNSSHAHPLLNPLNINPRYADPVGTNNVPVVRPLTATVLQRLQLLNNQTGLTDIYLRNLVPGQDPAATHAYAYDSSFKDLAYANQ